ncbi:MAG TPA: ROK family protein [Acidimicrobiales bacterium]|nr:ROK family protein [Acidimicrobiales bacterium]
MPEPLLVAGLDVGGTKTLAVAIDAAVDPAPQRPGEMGVAGGADGALGGAGGSGAGTHREDGDGAAHPAVAAAVRRPTGTGGGDRLVASTAGTLVALAEAAGVPVDGFAAVGVGVPGLVDRQAGTVRHAINLGLDDTPVALAGHLAALARAPVVIDNDVNLAAVGAAVALGCRGDLAYLSVGTGLAAGLLLDGRIRRGAHGAAGEIGHLPVDPHGPVCECGQRGCLEVLASGAAIAARRPAGGGALTAASDLLAAAEGGDAAARALVDDVAGHLAGAVALLAQTVDPEVVVLGGGVAEAGPGLLDAVRRSLRDRAARSPVLAAIALADRVALVPDGVPAGAIGAALLARHHLGRTSGPLASEPPSPAADDVSFGP